MSPTTTDAQLVSAHLGGDRTALASIYDRYAPGLFDTAASMLSDRHDAADMVHDVFVIAAERLGQLREPDRLKPWLYAVLRNEVYRRTKRRRRTTPTDFASRSVPDVPAPYDPREAGEAVAYEELASMLRSASAGLDERDRLVLELSIRQGLSGVDLADALGVTPDQSYSLVHRMRHRVEKSLGAFAVARAGRRDCPRLDALLASWDGEFSVLVRKRINRHIEECETCERSRQALAPLALFGAAPAFVLPLGLRDRVLAATSSPSPASVGPRRHGRFDARSGFPRAGRRILGWSLLASLVLIVGTTGVLIAHRSGDPTSVSIPSSDTTREVLILKPATPTSVPVVTTNAPVIIQPPISSNSAGSGGPTGGPPENDTVATTTTPSIPIASPPSSSLTSSIPPRTTTTTAPNTATATTTTAPTRTSTTAPRATTTSTTTLVATSTTAMPRLVLGKVAGAFTACSTLAVQASVTTDQTGVRVAGIVEFFDVNTKSLGTRNVELGLTSGTTWRGTVSDAPANATTAVVRLTARTPSGLASTASATANRTNQC